MQPTRSHYDVLEVTHESPWGEIKRSYNKLALKFHPDRRGADDKWAAQKFLQIQKAYECLKVDDKKAAYDQIMGFNQPKVVVHQKGASAIVYGDTREQLDMEVDDAIYEGEEVKAVFAGNKPRVYINHNKMHVQDADHWSNGVVDTENPDGTFTIFWPEYKNYSKGMTRDKIRKMHETEEMCKEAAKRHDRRVLKKRCKAKWPQDGNWYPAFLAGVNEDGTYEIFWPEKFPSNKMTSGVARADIKFFHQLHAEKNRDTYNKFFETGEMELFPNWEMMKEFGGVLSDEQRAIMAGEKFFKRLKRMKPDSDRKTYFIIEEQRWDIHTIKELIGWTVEEDATILSFDTSNPRGWSEEELIKWIENKFTKPMIVRKLSEFAEGEPCHGNASAFFTALQKPGAIKGAGIRLKSMQKKVQEAIKGMMKHDNVW